MQDVNVCDSSAQRHELFPWYYSVEKMDQPTHLSYCSEHGRLLSEANSVNIEFIMSLLLSKPWNGFALRTSHCYVKGQTECDGLHIFPVELLLGTVTISHFSE